MAIGEETLSKENHVFSHQITEPVAEQLLVVGDTLNPKVDQK